VVATPARLLTARFNGMRDELALTLLQIDQARGDLYVIADELQIVKAQIFRLPSRIFVSRLHQRPRL
jgi:hypothetical protein